MRSCCHGHARGAVGRRDPAGPQHVAGGKHAAGPHVAWITADALRGGFKVLITGPRGFERTVTCALDDDASVIADRVRETMEE